MIPIRILLVAFLAGFMIAASVASAEEPPSEPASSEDPPQQVPPCVSVDPFHTPPVYTRPC